MDRRQFLQRTTLLAPIFFAARSALSLDYDTAPFNLLVVGDSLIWGQGLAEQHKFYSLVREWLQTDVFANARPVNLKVKAHSGSEIFLHEEEIAALKNASRDEAREYFPEINISFPSIKSQLETAVHEYGSGDTVDLILLTGGITDLDVSKIVDPFRNNAKLKKDIARYCGEDMYRLLDYAAATYPNALIAVVGYFPMVSRKSSTGKIFNAILETYSIPRPLKGVVNNPLTHGFLKSLHKKMVRRSEIWVEDSDRAFQGVVERLNAKSGRRRAVFVKSPIPGDRSYGTANSLLWELGKNGRSEDEVYELRKGECKTAISGLRDVRLKFRQRFCEIAGIGHPNIEGARLYAEAIKDQLRQIVK